MLISFFGLCGAAHAAGNCSLKATCNEIFALTINENQVNLPPGSPGDTVSDSSLVTRVQSNKVNPDGSPFAWNLAVKSGGNLAGSGSQSIGIENLKYHSLLGSSAPTDDVYSENVDTTVSYSGPGLGTPVMWGTRSLGGDGSGVAATSSFTLSIPKSTMAGDYSCVLTYTLF